MKKEMEDEEDDSVVTVLVDQREHEEGIRRTNQGIRKLLVTLTIF